MGWKYKIMMLGVVYSLGTSSVAHATRITTGDLGTSNTAASPMVANIGATPNGSIRFDLGGAAFLTSAGQLTISIGVDAVVPSVTSGTISDQLFRDDIVGAAYFGYYLSTGVKSASQTSPNMNIKVKRGSAETSGRSFFLIGNGTTSPNSQSDLTIAPAGFTTFATTTSNSAHCGPQYASNGLTGSTINCGGGSTVTNMDLTQFVKVLDTDPTTGAVISQLEFIAVSE